MNIDKLKHMEKKTTITAPEGHYIDLENSKIVYKPIERELPKTWGDYCILTMTPSYKNLSMYDKLIKLRDYYNNGYRFNWNDTCNWDRTCAEAYYIIC